MTFDLHSYSPVPQIGLTVWVHDWPTACLDFRFNLHVGPPINRCRLYEVLHRF